MPCRANQATSRTDPPQLFCHVHCRRTRHCRRNAWTPAIAVAVNLLLHLHGRRPPPEKIVIVVIIERDLVRVVPFVAVTNRPNDAIAIIVVLVLPAILRHPPTTTVVVDGPQRSLTLMPTVTTSRSPPS
jgi:hypothetical protein